MLSLFVDSLTAASRFVSFIVDAFVDDQYNKMCSGSEWEDIMVNGLDIYSLLRSNELIDDNVVQGYTNMLRQMFSSLDVRVVNRNFYNQLRLNDWASVDPG